MPLHSLTAPLVATAGALRALVFPMLCLGCDRRMPEGEGAPGERVGERVPLCPSCFRRLARPAPEAARARMARLPTDAPRPMRVTALWTFDPGGTIRRLQHTLKYHGRPGLGVALGRLVGRVVAEAEGAPGYDALVPVPLGRARLLERGYNQAERLAHGAATAFEALPPVEGWIVRARPTRSQTALSRTRRWTNVSGAFALAPGVGALDGRRVLLIDDVLTTGATLAAAAAPLMAAGARVDLAVLACVAD